MDDSVGVTRLRKSKRIRSETMVVRKGKVGGLVYK